MFWRPRLSQKDRRKTVAFLRRYYDSVKWDSYSVRIKVAENDTRFLWIYLFARAFSGFG